MNLPTMLRIGYDGRNIKKLNASRIGEFKNLGVKPQEIGSKRNGLNTKVSDQYRKKSILRWFCDRERMNEDWIIKQKEDRRVKNGGTNKIMAKWNDEDLKKKELTLKKKRQSLNEWVNRYDGSKEALQGSKGTENVLFESIFTNEQWWCKLDLVIVAFCLLFHAFTHFYYSFSALHIMLILKGNSTMTL